MPRVPIPPPPRYASIIVALIPVFPPLYFLAFYGLRFINHWNRSFITALAIFLGSQLIAAALTPHPVASIGLALIRSMFIISLITTGAWFGDRKSLHPLLFGLVIVYVTALVSSFLTYGPDVVNLRLKHPYYTEVSLGLSGTVGLFLLATWEQGPRWVRLSLGALAMVIIALSGSRGALVALLTGGLGGALIGYRKLAPVFLSGLSLTALAAYFGQRSAAAHAIERLFSFSLTGRDRYWQDAWTTFIAHPWGGVGPYQLGPYLKSLYHGQCQFWPTLERWGLSCPEWLTPFSGAWIIAHNTLLHQLGEAGILGTLGLLALLGIIAYAVWKTRDPLLTAIFLAFMVMGLVDVPIAVPSLHLAELFWVSMGIALAKAGFFEQGSVGPSPDDNSNDRTG